MSLMPRFALVREWERQREGLMAFMEEASRCLTTTTMTTTRGVKGMVFMPDNSPAVGADVVVWGPRGERSARNTTTSLQVTAHGGHTSQRQLGLIVHNWH